MNINEQKKQNIQSQEKQKGSEARKSYTFDRNPKRNALSKKDGSKIFEKKPRINLNKSNVKDFLASDPAFSTLPHFTQRNL